MAQRCQDASGKFGYKVGLGGTRLTGAGVLCLQFWKNAGSYEVRKGLNWIVANQTKEWKDAERVRMALSTPKLAFRQPGSRRERVIGEFGTRIFSKSFAVLKKADGHWPRGAYFSGDSEIYRTTMTILMLQVYYRYMPSPKSEKSSFHYLLTYSPPPLTLAQRGAFLGRGMKVILIALVAASTMVARRRGC